MNERFDEFASVEFVVPVGVVHLEVVELQLLLGHRRSVHRQVHVLLQVPEMFFSKGAIKITLVKCTPFLRDSLLVRLVQKKS